MKNGPARKWISGASGLAIAAGATLTVMGVLAPSAQASTTSAYRCTMHSGVLGDVNFAMTMDIQGELPGSVQEGDDATLSGFQTIGQVPASLATALIGLGATTVSGSYDSFEVDASIGDASLPPAHPSMDINPVSVPLVPGPIELDAPASPTDLTFPAAQPGTLQVSAPSNFTGTLVFDKVITGPQSVPFDCQGAALPIASTTVTEKPAPPTTPSSPTTPPGGGHPSGGHSSPPSQHDASQPAGLSNGNPSSVAPTQTTSSVSATSTSRASNPQLAKTGSAAVQMGIGGAALILVGGGLMFAARRRREVGDDA